MIIASGRYICGFRENYGWRALKGVGKVIIVCLCLHLVADYLIYSTL